MTRKEREKEGREKWFRDSQFFIDAVREGREVEGFWEGKLMRGVAEGFRLDGPWPFLIGRTWTNNARPIPQKLRRYLGPVDMMRWLVEHGYKPNYEGGWTCYGNCPFSPAMWQYCDTPEVEGDHGYSYHIEWIVGMYE